MPNQNAPKDGTRILLHYVTQGFCSKLRTYVATGDKWEECRWVDNKATTGSAAHWEPWCGKATTSTSHHIAESEVIAWLPLPQDADAPPITKEWLDGATYFAPDSNAPKAPPQFVKTEKGGLVTLTPIEATDPEPQYRNLREGELPDIGDQVSNREGTRWGDVCVPHAWEFQGKPHPNYHFRRKI